MNPPSALLYVGAAWLLWKILQRIIRSSPLDQLNGPKSVSWFSGNLSQLFNRHGWGFVDGLANDYGSVSKIYGLFGKQVLHLYDPLALHHIILKDAQFYDEAPWFYEMNQMTFGPGLLSVNGDHHRKQRKMLNPVFSIAHMRHMTPIFYRVAHKLKDAILNEVQDESNQVNMLGWMGRAALELVGQGGLGYSFDPLTESVPNDFGDALKAFLPLTFSFGPFRFFTHYAKYFGSPTFRRKLIDYLPIKRLHRVAEVVDQIYFMSKKIFDSKKAALAAGDEAVLEQVGEGKDILSVLMKANMVASEEDRLPEDELLGQMSTLVFAASDTTSTALTQILHALAEHPEAQEKLREEISEASRDGDIPYDELVDRMPYMDAICRETLRLHPPVTFVFRESLKDNILPFSEPITTKDGTTITEMPVDKGTTILISLRACNRNKAIWGEDALEWKPERWLTTLPKTVTDAKIPGVYSNLMTFLGGGRSCIGFKFSQLEMKVILSVLLTTFKISLPDNKDDIVWNLAGVRYPTVGNDTKPSFPMKVERLLRSEL
ncbi:cytochrome P450-dit2 [Steccherinum ochraceum]|uniref:Cytochrome P450-dit2 n=1 Tax=Steccherinum ochraceum TaxID=92696 RepID=A0A4R0RPW5_9APHY|nr:cytochrome P450-dit2 [Steccherinum ochraceum]